MAEHKIIIVGAGGHGIVVADIIQNMQKADKTINIRGFIDGDKQKHGTNVFNCDVLGSYEIFDKYPDDQVVIAVGDNLLRKKVALEQIQSRNEYFSAIHPDTVISESSQTGEGSMVCANVVVNPESRIGNQVILNTASSVDHHNVIGDFVHIAPGAHLGGEVTIGEGVLVGMGSTILPRINIGDWAVVGAGSVVFKDVPPRTLVLGNPAKVVKEL